MKYNFFPDSSIQISNVTLGTMMFGGKTNQEEAHKMMDYAFANGVNAIDTANCYNSGESEKIVGNWLSQKNRSDIILSAKVGKTVVKGLNCRGLSRRNIIKAVDDSLERLKTDYIDILYLHSPDYNTSLLETLKTTDQLVRDGKVRYLGVSNYAAWQIADILSICKEYRLESPMVTQNVYNAITRSVESELVPFIKEHKIGMTIFNPIAAGLLTGKYSKDKVLENSRFAENKSYHDRYWSDINFDAVDKMEAIAAKNGMSVLQLAINWCLNHNYVTSTILGVSNFQQIQQNLSLIMEEPLSEEIMAECDEVWSMLADKSFAYNR